MWVCGTSACLSAYHMLGASESQKGPLDSLDWSYRWLWATMWGMGLEPGSSGWAASVLNPWANSSLYALFWVATLLKSLNSVGFTYVSHCWRDLYIGTIPLRKPSSFFAPPKFQDEMGFSNMEDDGPEEEERATESRPSFNTPQALRYAGWDLEWND